MNSKLRIGCVADDFTGASDAASFMVAGGLRTVLVNGIPEPAAIPGDFDAVVIALKSRTQETGAAVADSLAAFDWLRAAGAETLYLKYCSTFDSTPQGNIGPVIDAVLDRYDVPYTVVCPSLLVNKRSVRDGVLYVGDVPLAESHMKNHPLTPMWDSDICKLLQPQGKYPCFRVTPAELADTAALDAKIADFSVKNKRFYLVPDYFEPEHGRQIAAYFAKLAFLTGGSGLCGDLAAFFSNNGSAAAYRLAPTAEPLPRVIVAGSCSVATRGQVKNYLEAGGAAMEVEPGKLGSGGQDMEMLEAFLKRNAGNDVLFYSSGSAGSLKGCAPDPADADRLERTLAALAVKAVENGCRRLVAAGGETSGAVTQALGHKAFFIGASAAPGVPIMVPTDRPELALVLKSGNFGDEKFFLTALR